MVSRRTVEPSFATKPPQMYGRFSSRQQKRREKPPSFPQNHKFSNQNPPFPQQTAKKRLDRHIGHSIYNKVYRECHPAFATRDLILNFGAFLSKAVPILLIKSTDTFGQKYRYCFSRGPALFPKRVSPFARKG